LDGQNKRATAWSIDCGEGNASSVVVEKRKDKALDMSVSQYWSRENVLG
jgi:hypothetical protein